MHVPEHMCVTLRTACGSWRSLSPCGLPRVRLDSMWVYPVSHPGSSLAFSFLVWVLGIKLLCSQDKYFTD